MRMKFSLSPGSNEREKGTVPQNMLADDDDVIISPSLLVSLLG